MINKLRGADLLARIAFIAICLTVTGCAEVTQNIAESITDNLFESKAEAKRKREDPALMIEEIDRKRRQETLRDIERQNTREESAKKKQFDEMLQKQMQQEQGHPGVNEIFPKMKD